MLPPTPAQGIQTLFRVFWPYSFQGHSRQNFCNPRSFDLSILSLAILAIIALLSYCIVIVAFHEITGEKLFPQVTALRILKKRGHAGNLEGKYPFPFKIQRFCHRCCLCNNSFRQSGKIFLLIQNKFETIGFGKQVLSELDLKPGKFLIDTAEFFLVSGREGCAASYKIFVGILKQFLFLISKLKFFPVVINRFYPPEKGVVEVNIVPVV